MNNREISLLAAEIGDMIMSRVHNEEEYEKVVKLVSALLGVNCNCFGLPKPPNFGVSVNNLKAGR